jgi:uncharacterized protein YjbI with pentapeptide repeats/tetratricopeptide (TPR) repeat protein
VSIQPPGEGSELSTDAAQLHDLDGDLRGRELRDADLRGVDLRGRDLQGADLAGADLRGADLRDAGLLKVNLRHANLSGARLSGADLSEADLSNADLEGAVLDGATLDRAVLHNSRLDGARIRDSHWTGAEIQGGTWVGVDLTGAVLQKVSFSDLTLQEAVLAGVRVDDSDLVRVKMDSVHAAGLTIADSSLADLEIKGGSLEGAVFRFANLERVRLEGVEFREANVESVLFRNCEFVDCSVEDARFVRCAGLGRELVDRLREQGADIPLPMYLRVWRALGRLPGGRAVAAVAALALIAPLGYGLLFYSSELDGSELSRPVGKLFSSNAGAKRQWDGLEERYRSYPKSRPETLAEMATLLEKHSYIEEAEDKLREAVGLSRLLSDGPPLAANIALSRFLLRNDGSDAAFDVAREIVDSAGNIRGQLPGYLLLARARIGQGDAEGARFEVATVQGALHGDPGAPVAYRLEAASILRDLGDLAGALLLLSRPPEDMAPEDRAQGLLFSAELLAGSGNTARAVARYDEVLAAYHELPLIVAEAREGRSKLLSSGGDPELEAKKLVLLAEAEDLDTAVQGELGLARLDVRMENRSSAVRRYEKILERFATRPDLTLPATIELAELHRSGGDRGEALRLLQEAEGKASKPEAVVRLREQLSQIWQDAGDYRKAEDVLERTLVEFKEEPEYIARARLRIAGIADQAGRLDFAIEGYREVAEANIDPAMTAAASFGHAALLRRVGRTSEALPLMDKALAALPASHPMRGAIAVERAELLVEVGKSSLADLEDMLSQAREAGLEESQPVAYNELLLLMAKELLASTRYDDAMSIFTRVATSAAAAETKALRQGAVEGRVAVLMALGRKEEAEDLLNEMGVAQLSSGDAADNCAARMSLARARVETDELKAAVAEMTAVFETCRAPRFLLQELPVVSDLLVSRGLFAETVAMLKGISEADVGAIGKQAAELELGRLGSAEDLEKAMVGPDRSLAALARVERAQLYVGEGRLAEAEPLWREVLGDPAVEPVPRSLAQLGLGRLALARGDTEQALTHFQEVRKLSKEPWILQQADGLLRQLGAVATGAPAAEPAPARTP